MTVSYKMRKSKVGPYWILDDGILWLASFDYGSTMSNWKINVKSGSPALIKTFFTVPVPM